MKYRKLNRYKYSVMDDYTVQVNIHPTSDLKFEFMELSTTGQLSVKLGYAWDGITPLPATPKCGLRGSLVHDVLYQMMRLGALDYTIYRINKTALCRR